MRELTTPAGVERFMRELGRLSREPTSVYFTGGVTALLHGWRPTTVDIDLKVLPESDALLREIPKLKELLRVNLELAAPDDFIPELPGWQERSIFIERHGSVSYFHYDLYAQALSKIERGHVRDLEDVHRMLAEGHVEPARLRELFEAIEPSLYRFPAVDPKTFRRRVHEIAGR